MFRILIEVISMKELFQSASENLTFLLVCLVIFLALIALAKTAEKLTKSDVRHSSGARHAAFLGISAALGGVLMCLELPLFFAPGFYKLDFSELPVLITAFYFGPTAGVVTEFLKVVIKLLLKGTSTAFVGDFANFVVGCSFILPAAIVYHIRKSRKTAIAGMAAGTLILTVFGSLFNAVYLIPTFSKLFGMPLEAIVGMGQAVNPAITNVHTLVLMAVVPFNLLKGILVSIVTYLLYKRVESVLSRLFLGRDANSAQRHVV